MSMTKVIIPQVCEPGYLVHKSETERLLQAAENTLNKRDDVLG